MEKKRIFLIVLLALAFSSVSFSMAGFVYSNNNVQTDYSGGELINGWVNISFVNESSRSMFSSNFNGGIGLLDLLKANSFLETGDYNCTTKNCINNYATNGEANLISIKAGEVKTIGFKLTGKSVEINSLEMDIASDTQPSCYRQMLINPLAESDLVIQNPDYSLLPCNPKLRGCFDANAGDEQAAIIGERPYCEQIELPIGPAFEVGAEIQNSSNGQTNLKMELVSLDRQVLGRCTLPKNTKQIEELECIINYSNPKPQSFFVCVYSEPVGGTRYAINSESSGEVCGIFGVDSEEYGADYNIFARTMMFGPVNFTLNEAAFKRFLSGESLKEKAQEYISSTYGGDCQQGCFIPFEIYTNFAQNIFIKNPRLEYSSVSGTRMTDKVFFFKKEDPKINSKFLMINILPANFTIPVSTNQKHFKLYLNNSLVFQLFNITIASGFDFDIAPKVVLVGIETEFRAIGKNIASSSWKFGDDAAINVGGDKTRYRFLNEGMYALEVSAINKSGATAKRNFKISVGNQKEAVSSLISFYESDLNRFLKQLSNFSTWIRGEIGKKINFTQINSTFYRLKKEFNESSERNYSHILSALLSLDIPNSVYISQSWKNLPLEIASSEINLNYIEKISNDSAADKDGLKLKIADWMRGNYNAKISAEGVSLKGKNTDDVLFTRFLINLTAKTSNQTNAYFIIDRPKGAIIFSEDYGAQDITSGLTSGTYIPVSGSKIIEFMAPGKIEPSELKAYLSPNIGIFLEKAKILPPGEPENPKEWWARLWYIILALGIFVIYILMQEWYKKKYESHLFKDKNDLYNIINFIYNSRVSGLSDKQIKVKLEDSGWAGEQVSFAFKKIDGKRTGMFEIPIFKIFEKRKIQQEIEKRQGLPPGARFIKRF